MVTVQFYHLTATPLERALPKLLEKAVSGGYRLLLVADSDERVEYLNQLLWTYDPGSFLPHGSLKDGHPAQQPILLVSSPPGEDAAPNNANILVVTNGLTPSRPDQYERILDIFHGQDAAAVEQARLRWTSYKNAGISVNYMRQNDSGGWDKK